MARSTTSGGDRPDAPDTETDRAVPDETPNASATPDASLPPLDASVDAPDTAQAATARDTTVIEDAVVIPPEPEPEPATAADPAPVPTPVIADDPPPMAASAPRIEDPTPVTPAPVREPPARRPSVLPLVFGGAVAAALGYAASWTDLLPRPPDPALTAQIAALTTAQDDLRAAVDALAARPVEDADARAQIGSVQSAVAALDADLAAQSAALAADTGALRSDATGLADRLTTLENRPQVTVALSEQAQAAVEAQIAQLRQEAADGIARVEQDRAALLDQTDARLGALDSDLRATLATIQDERAALEAARAAAAAETQANRQAAAAATVRAAIDAGTPFAEPLAALAALTGTEPPADLASRADEGVPSLVALRDGYADAARAALEATLRAQVDAGEIGRIEGFWRIHSGVRSLTPRDGDDPDAILSRGDAALAAGDLDGTMALVATLPEAGRAAMAPWVAQADIRRAAVAALAAFGDS